MHDWERVYTLTRFILEVRKKNGDVYPAETLYEIVVCLQMFLNSHGINIQFLDDIEYIYVRNCLDNRIKELSCEGNVAKSKKADIITLVDENLMWPKQLVNTVLYLFGVHFALRASVEHQSLCVCPNSQLKLGLDRDRRFLEYSEDVSKTRQGGLDHHNVGRKIVRAYASICQPDRCVVNLYEKYLSHRPIHINLDDFYLRPLANVKNNTWYASQPIDVTLFRKLWQNWQKKQA